MDNTEIKEQIQDNLSSLIGEYGWLLLAAFVVLFFKSSIESVLAGLTIFLGNDFNADDIIILNGKPARVVRIGIWKSTFYAYTIVKKGDAYTISGGTKLVYENTKLKDLKIEKPLQNFDLESIVNHRTEITNGK